MKSKILVVILLVVVIGGLLSGLIYLSLTLQKANSNIAELASRLDNKSSVNEYYDQNDETGNKEVVREVTKEISIDNNKEDVQYLEDKSIKWYREELEHRYVKAVVTDNSVFFFVGDRASHLDGTPARPYDGFEAKLDGPDIVGAKFVKLGENIYDALVFVLSDGTVKYISFESILNKDYTFHTIENLSNVLDIRGVALSTSDGRVFDTAIVIKKDGTKELINHYIK